MGKGGRKNTRNKNQKNKGKIGNKKAWPGPLSFYAEFDK